MFPEILFLFFALALVTFVGHGIWVVLARIFGGGRAPEVVTAPTSNCPRCGLPLSHECCDACHWPEPLVADSTRSALGLNALAKHVQRFSAQGLVDVETQERLLQAIAVERSQLGERSAAPATTAAAEAIVAEVVEEQPAEPHVAAKAPHRERDFAAHVPLHERADAFRQRRAEERPGVEELSTTSAAASVSVPPRRSWADLLAAFMEERNIRWGELVGGLLIVCGSIALVISFWSAIAERPLVKFLLFNGVTAGIFGVGFHSEHRWRLHTTSQGLLMIGGLLAPLNFLAIAAFTSGAAANHPLTLGGEFVSTLLFSALLFMAGRILVPGNALALTAGVIVPSLAQLLVRRHAGPAIEPQMIWTLAALPIGCYVVAGGWSSWRLSACETPNEEEVNGLLKFLGMASFAALMPLALLLVKCEQPLGTLREMAAGVSLLGAVPLTAGLVIWQRLAGGQLAGPRTAGMSIAVFGALVSLAGLVVGWPEPASMLPVALIEFVVFTWVAWRLNLPIAHLVAAACLAIGYLLAIYLFQGRLEWRGQELRALAEVVISGSTGALLSLLVLAYAGIAFVTRRRAPEATGWLTTSPGVMACAAAALATLSVALASWFGFARAGDPHGATWVYLLYAAGALVVAARRPHAVFAWIGAALLLAAVVQGFMFRYPLPGTQFEAALACVLLYGSVCAALAWAAHIPRLIRGESQLGGVLASAAFLASVAAAVWLIWLAPTATAAFEAPRWLWLAVLWLALGVFGGWQPAFMLVQLGLAAAAVFGVGAILEQRTWFAASRWPWLDPWTLEAVGLALAGLTLGWTVIRFVVARRSAGAAEQSVVVRTERILSSPWVAVDRWIAGGLVVLLLGIGTYAVWPGVCQELAPRDSNSLAVGTVRSVPAIERFALPTILHEHAGQVGSWLLLGAMLIVVGTLAMLRRSTNWLLALLPVAFVACLLVACRFKSDVAVASALRWTSAGWLLLASAPIWGRSFLQRIFSSEGWKPSSARAALHVSATWLVFALGLVAPLAMMISTGIAALARSPHGGSLASDWIVLWLVCGVALLASVILWSLARQAAIVDPGGRAVWWPVSAAIALVLAVAPALAVLLYEIGIALAQSPIVGPEPASIFGRVGLAVSYGVPLILAALTLVGYALRQRSAAFALAGGLVLNVAATAGYLLAPRTGGLVFDAALWIRLAQLNAVLAAVYGSAWLAAERRGQRRREDRRTLAISAPFGTQIALAPALLVLVLGFAWCDLVIHPQGHPGQTRVMNAELADPWGLACVAVVAIAGAGVIAAARRRVSIFMFCAAAGAIIVLAAVTAGRWDQGFWLAYNTLGVGHALSRLRGAGNCLARSSRRTAGRERVAQRLERHARSQFGRRRTAWIDGARAGRQPLVAGGRVCGVDAVGRRIGLGVPTASLSLRCRGVCQCCWLARLVGSAVAAGAVEPWLRQRRVAGGARATVVCNRNVQYSE